MPQWGQYMDSLEDLKYGLLNDLVTPSTAFSTLVGYKSDLADQIAQERAARMKARREQLMQGQEFVSGIGEDILGWAQDDVPYGSLESLIEAQSALAGVDPVATMQNPQIAGALSALYQGGPQHPSRSSPASFDQDDIESIQERVKAAAGEATQTRANVRAYIRKLVEQTYGPAAYASFRATIDNAINQAWTIGSQEAGLPEVRTGTGAGGGGLYGIQQNR